MKLNKKISFECRWFIKSSTFKGNFSYQSTNICINTIINRTWNRFQDVNKAKLFKCWILSRWRVNKKIISVFLSKNCYKINKISIRSNMECIFMTNLKRKSEYQVRDRSVQTLVSFFKYLLSISPSRAVKRLKINCLLKEFSGFGAFFLIKNVRATLRGTEKKGIKWNSAIFFATSALLHFSRITNVFAPFTT